MNNKPYIFIFTCIYNDSKHIFRLLESILKQKYECFVYFLYDDASTDDLSAMVNQFKKELSLKKPNIVFHYEKGNKNLGINASTQHCLQILKEKYAYCKYFIWMNSDDWLEDNALELFIKQAKKKRDTSIFLPNIYYVNEYENGGISKKYKLFKNRHFVFEKEKQFFNFFFGNVIWTHFYVKTDVFFAINPKGLIFDNSKMKCIYNDMCLMFLFSINNSSFGYIKKPLSCCLIRNDRLSKNTKYYTRMEEKPYLDEYLLACNKSLYNDYCTTFKLIEDSLYKIKQTKNRKEAKRIIKNMEAKFKAKGLPKYYAVDQKTKLKICHPFIYKLVFNWRIKR